MASKLGLTGVFILFVLATLTACGGDGDGAAPASGGTAVTTVIGPAGGTLTGPDGVQVEVPAGALDQPTGIVIARSAAGAPAALDAYPVAGNVYELTPHDLLFNLPVTLRAPVPSGALGTSVFMASPGEDWNLKDAVVVNGVAEWQRNSFSWMYWGGSSDGLNLACMVPASMANDPYWCASSSSRESIGATPAQALTLTSPPYPGAGSYRVDQAATLHLRSALSIAGNCRNVAVRLFRTRFDESTQAWSPWQLLSTQSPALTVVGSRLNGTATFNSPFTYLDNGKNHLYLKVTYECPGIIRPNSSNGNTYSWDYSNYRSSFQGGGTLVVGNIALPTVFYTVGGSVSGLTGTGLVLQNNGGDNRAVTANGAFVFSVGADNPYNVMVFTQPTGQTCTVQNGSGTAQANVSNVAVRCGVVAISPTNPTAIGCSYIGTEGTVTFTASGGTAPYTWSTSEGVNGLEPVNLIVTSATQAQWYDTSDNFCSVGGGGIVTITVTDSIGDTASATMTVQSGG